MSQVMSKVADGVQRPWTSRQVSHAKRQAEHQPIDAIRLQLADDETHLRKPFFSLFARMEHGL